MTDLRKKTEDVIDNKKETDIIDRFDAEKISRYNRAIKHKMFLRGSVRKYAGYDVDFAHFDFLLSQIKFPDGMDFLTCLKMFWANLDPYLSNMIEHLDLLDNSFKELVEDQNIVLKNYADQQLELRCYKDFLDQLEDKDLKYQFNTFFNQRKKEDEEAIARAVRKENLKLLK
jgi:hypothetical protein